MTDDRRDRDGAAALWSGNTALVAGGAVVAAVGLALLRRPVRACPDLHVATQLAGSEERLTAWLGSTCRVTAAQLRATLAWDVLFIAGYVALLAGLLRRWRQCFRGSRLRRVMEPAWVLALLTGLFDLAENVATAVVTRVDAGRPTYRLRPVGPLVIATLAWLKWVLFAACVVLIAIGLMSAFARFADRCDRPLRPRRRAAAVATTTADTAPVVTTEGALGVCCSGGGIRAAAFSIGALGALERGGVLRRARWLSAVSGGSYAATAWRLAKVGPAADPATAAPAADDVAAWLTARDADAGDVGRHRFLRNGPGGFGRALLAGLLYVAITLVAEAVFVYLFAWPLGRLLSSRAVAPALYTGDGHLPRTLSIGAEQWGPGVGVLGVAVVVLAVSTIPKRGLSNAWKAAAVIAALGALLEIVLVGMPWAMVRVGRWLAGGTSGMAKPAATTGGITAASVVALVWGFLRSPLESRLRAQAPRLGGLLLAVLVVLWGGKVASDAAVHGGPFASARLWAATFAVAVVLYLTVNTTELSLHRVYRKRLRRSFGLRRRAGTLTAPDERDQVTWAELAADRRARAGTDPVPELLVCCAQQRTGLAPAGLPAASFTISETAVQLGDTFTPTARYVARLPRRSQREQYVASWMATSGAAFASSMGRLSVGSTNALMAALNIDLGVWLPNPLLDVPGDRLPRVRFGYLLKEILGWYDDTDRYVFVADGGHWENLGLVELLRRRCGTIVCLDASGDTVGAFTTLRQAADLALLELPDVVARIDLDGLDTIRGASGTVAPSCVTTLTVHYVGGTTGTIHYAKAQVATDLDIELRRYAAADRRFPNYSTGNQFLTRDQFAALVALGRASGERLVTRLRA